MRGCNGKGGGELRSGLIAGALLCKPQLIAPLLVVWTAMWCWRALLGLAISAIVILGLSLLVSVAATSAYIHTVPGLAFQVGAALSKRGSTAALLPAGPFQLLIGLVLIGVVVLIWKSRSARTTRLAALWLLPVLATPHLGAYDLALGLLPVSILSARLRHRRLFLAALAAVWLSPMIWVAGLAWAPGASFLLVFLMVLAGWLKSEQ